MSERPWFRHYDEGVPCTLKPYPQVTLPDLLRQIASEHPEYPSMLFMGNVISYGELEELSNAFAASLCAMGVQKGDRVAVLLPNTPQMLIAEFGIWKAGGIAVLLNPLWTGHEIERAIDECEAEIAVVLAPFYEKINNLRSRTSLKSVVLSGLQDYFPESVRNVSGMDGKVSSSLFYGDFEMLAMIESHRNSAVPEITVHPADPALFLFSGGTTGKPKCAIGRHEAMIMTGMQVNVWFSLILGQERSVIMLNLPLYHVYPQVAMMPLAFLRSAPVALIPDPRDTEMLIRTVNRLKVALLPGVPTLFNALASHPLLKEEPQALSSL